MFEKTFNLRKFNGIFKGYVGECMFKLVYRSTTINRLENMHLFFKKHGHLLSEKQRYFLHRFWYSIDGIKFSFNTDFGSKKITLFEIKTKNKYECPKPWWLCSFTSSTERIYSYAKNLGFEVKVAIVWLHDDWNFSIEIKEFDEIKKFIDKPKKRDRTDLDFDVFESGR